MSRSKCREDDEGSPGHKGSRVLNAIHVEGLRLSKGNESKVIFRTVHTTLSGKEAFVKRKPLSIFSLLLSFCFVVVFGQPDEVLSFSSYLFPLDGHSLIG
jgi:hypothetical protein